MIPEKIIELSKKYNISVERDLIYCDDNQAACGNNTIFLGKFDDPDIEITAFFHELGHIQSSREYFKNGYHLCKISSESLAWEKGISLAWEEGFKWKYDSKELEYARKCLLSYFDEKNFK